MDPLTALLLSLWMAGYFTKNIYEDAVFKARGEDPPSFRREQERRRRRQDRAAGAEPNEAGRFVRDAWNDAWASANERRARAHAKRDERRQAKWREQDTAAAEDEAHRINDALNDGQNDGRNDGQNPPGGQDGRDERAVPDPGWQRCADCGRPTSAPQTIIRYGLPVQVCRTCQRAQQARPDQHIPEPTPGPESGPAAGPQEQPPVDGTAPRTCVCRRCGTAVPMAQRRMVPDLADPSARVPVCPACHTDSPDEPAGEPTGRKEDTPFIDEFFDADPEEGAQVIEFSAWRRSTNNTDSTKENSQMTSGESTNLNAAVSFTGAMAGQADSAVTEVELSIAGLQGGGVSGPALTALTQAMEAFGQAAAALRAAHNELTAHRQVQEAYYANAGAGSREFVTTD